MAKYSHSAIVELPINYILANQSERRLAREEYVERQGGRCQHCGNPLSGSPTKDILDKDIDRMLFPLSFFDCPVHLHHNHATGMTIGAVHNLCNAVLWQYYGE